MILEALITLFVKAIEVFVVIFPTSLSAGVDLAINNSLIWFFTQLHKADYFLPTGTLFTVFGIILFIETTAYIFNFVNWVFHKITGH